MEFKKTTLNGVWMITPRVFNDHRGFFLESYSQAEFERHGIHDRFVQDNHSKSVHKGVVRGLHYQSPPCTQSKIVRAIRGAVYDVVVDIRKQSATFGQWEGFELSESNFVMVYVPHGFAHGFCTLEENSEIMYKVDNPYSPDHDTGILWNDPAIGIRWPVDTPVLSEKDTNLPPLNRASVPF
jgi:dTDP-4-dehydrorhamnose 3,5-epimerase